MTKKASNGKVEKKKAMVTVDLTPVITDVRGEAYDCGVFGQHGRDVTMTLGALMIEVLSMFDGQAKGPEKERRGRLAITIFQAEDSVEMLRDDVEKTRDLIAEKLPIPVACITVADLFKKTLEE